MMANTRRKLTSVVRRISEWAEDATYRNQCRTEGHLWDSERPRGPIHKRDICWRCGDIQEDR